MDNSIEKSEKSRILDTLISIRAGLSYISDVRDKIVTKENEITSLNKVRSDVEKDIHNNIRSIEENKHLVENLEKQLKKKKEDKDRYERQLQGNKQEKLKYEKSTKAIILSTLFIIAGIVLGVGCIIGLYSNCSNATSANTSGGTFNYLLRGLGFIAGIIVGGFLLFTAKGFFDEAKSKTEKNRKMAANKKEETVEELENALSRTEKDIRTLEYKIPEAKLNVPTTLARLAEERSKMDENIEHTEKGIALAKAEKERLADEGTQVYLAIKDAYGEAFHPDNWKYLDRVVYYLTTGRADNLKDALSILDQRLNAELIASEIQASSEMLSNEIRQSKQEITATLIKCADEISSSIYFVGKTIVQSNAIVTDRISDSIAAQAESIRVSEQMVNAQELNNSLQRKVNKTSEDPLKDYRYINGLSKYR